MKSTILCPSICLLADDIAEERPDPLEAKGSESGFVSQNPAAGQSKALNTT